MYVEVLAILLDTPEPDRDLDRLLTVLDEYAALLRTTGREDEAAEAAARASGIRAPVSDLEGRGRTAQGERNTDPARDAGRETTRTS